MSLESARRKSSSIPLSIVNKKLAVSPYNVNGNALLGKQIRINYLKSKKYQASQCHLKLTMPTGVACSTASGLANAKAWKYSDKEVTTLSKASHFKVVHGHFGKQTASDYPTEETNKDEKSKESSDIQPRCAAIPEHRTKTLTKEYVDQRQIETVSPKDKHETASLKYKKYKIIRSWTSLQKENNAIEESPMSQRNWNGEEDSNKLEKDTSKFKRRPLQTSETPYFVIAPNQNRNNPVAAENKSKVPFSVRQSDQLKSSGKSSLRHIVTQDLTDLPKNISNDLCVSLHEEVRDVKTSNKKIYKPAAATVNLECKINQDSRKKYENNSSHEMNQNSNDVPKTQEDLCEISKNGENIIVQNSESNSAEPSQDIHRQGVKKGTQRKINCCPESEGEHNLIKTESETINTQTSIPDAPRQNSCKAEEASGGDQEDFTLEHDPTIVIQGTSILQRLQAFSSALKLWDNETQTLKKKGTLEKASNDVLETIGAICTANMSKCEEFLVKNIDDDAKRCHHLRKKHKLRILTNYILRAGASKKLKDKLFLLRQLFMMLKFNDGSHLVQKRTLTEDQESNPNTQELLVLCPKKHKTSTHQ